MAFKTKLIVIMSAMAAGISSAVVFILTRTGRHAATAAKVAATSTAVATMTVPMFLSDKVCLSDFGRYAPEYCEAEKHVMKSFGELFAKQKCDEAIHLFEKLQGQYDANESGLLKAWLLAAFYEDTPTESKNKAENYILNRYSLDKMNADTDLEVWGLVAVAALTTQTSEAGLDYVIRMLDYTDKTDTQHNKIISTVAAKCMDYLMGTSEPDDRQKRAKRRLLDAFIETFGPDSVQPYEWSMDIQNKIIFNLIESGDEQAVIRYYGSVLEALAKNAEGEKYIQQFIEKNLAAAERATKAISKEAIEKMIIKSAEYIPMSVLEEHWSNLLGRIAKNKRRSYSVELLEQYGASAAAVVPCLLVKSDKSVPVKRIVKDNLKLLTYEIEAGIAPKSLDHLLNELRLRNADSEIVEITEFLWRTFPTENIGLKAFVVWLENQKSAAGKALTGRICSELMESYSGQPIALKARYHLAELYITQGHVIEGLLLIDELKEEGNKTKLFTAERLSELIEQYVKQQETNVQREEVVMSLAEQLRSAGQGELAMVFYCRLSAGKNPPLVNPRTGFAPDAAAAYAKGGSELLIQQLDFWRSLALAATGKKIRAAEVMAGLLEKEPEYPDAYLGQLFLAKHHYQQARMDEAWRYLKLLPQDVRDSEQIAEIYTRASIAVPAQRRHAQNMEKIENLKQFLMEHPNASEGDSVTMQLGQLLTREGKYAEAALNFETLVKQYQQSTLCPEALYRAIKIYRNKIPNPERADQLTKMLKERFPESIHSHLLNK